MRTVTRYPAGEPGFAGAEGATAPETLRQKDRGGDDSLESRAAGTVLTEGVSPGHPGQISQVDDRQGRGRTNVRGAVLICLSKDFA